MNQSLAQSQISGIIDSYHILDISQFIQQIIQQQQHSSEITSQTVKNWLSKRKHGLIDQMIQEKQFIVSEINNSSQLTVLVLQSILKIYQQNINILWLLSSYLNTQTFKIFESFKPKVLTITNCYISPDISRFVSSFNLTNLFKITISSMPLKNKDIKKLMQIKSNCLQMFEIYNTNMTSCAVKTLQKHIHSWNQLSLMIDSCPGTLMFREMIPMMKKKVIKMGIFINEFAYLPQIVKLDYETKQYQEQVYIMKQIWVSQNMIVLNRQQYVTSYDQFKKTLDLVYQYSDCKVDFYNL